MDRNDATGVTKPVCDEVQPTQKLKTTLQSLFSRFRLDRVKINAQIIQMEFAFESPDQDAAWELYVEMLTRIVTQPLPRGSGDDKAALNSVHSLFPTTRRILRRHGRKAVSFAKVAIPVLNQIVRPFTAKWHPRLKRGQLRSEGERAEFRNELDALACDLRNYNRLLACIAGVEDLTDLEREGKGPGDAHEHDSIPETAARSEVQKSAIRR